ncbi:MAG: hypothetical protein A3F67_02555 [Verrucomicrobia bacterium RIFCSPHIGHO2_12_FULL_41_10]|nr:MAG: hypothetical protein A3F67_02555 [Verrucomicrobia bacterium RIFCSPHIGHO2_12_FULL_41_10]HLB34033.1 hypothetical protein [Chthoniobacterales bacterium]
MKTSYIFILTASLTLLLGTIRLQAENRLEAGGYRLEAEKTDKEVLFDTTNNEQRTANCDNSGTDMNCHLMMMPSTVGKVVAIREEVGAVRAITASGGSVGAVAAARSAVYTPPKQAIVHDDEELYNCDFDDDAKEGMKEVINNVKKQAIWQAAKETYIDYAVSEDAYGNMSAQGKSTRSPEEFEAYFDGMITKAKQEAIEAEEVAVMVKEQADLSGSSAKAREKSIEKATEAHDAYDSLIRIYTLYREHVAAHYEGWKLDTQRIKYNTDLKKAETKKAYWAREIEEDKAGGGRPPTIIIPPANNWQGNAGQNNPSIVAMTPSGGDDKLLQAQIRAQEAQGRYLQEQAAIQTLQSQELTKRAEVKKVEAERARLLAEEKNIAERIKAAEGKATADKLETDGIGALAQERTKAAEKAKRQAEEIANKAKIIEKTYNETQAEVDRWQAEVKTRQAEVFRIKATLSKAEAAEHEAAEKVREATEKAKTDRLEAEKAKALAEEKAKEAEKAKFQAEEAARETTTAKGTHAHAQAEVDTLRSEERTKKAAIAKVEEKRGQVLAEAQTAAEKVREAEERAEDARIEVEKAKALIQRMQK